MKSSGLIFKKQENLYHEKIFVKKLIKYQKKLIQTLRHLELIKELIQTLRKLLITEHFVKLPFHSYRTSSQKTRT